MKIPLLVKILQLSVIYKAIFFKKGSLIALSLPISVGVIGSFKLLFKNVDPFDMVLPIISITLSFLLYFLFFIVDFIWGLSASKYENKTNPDWVESDKLYNSIGKIGGVILIDVLLLSIILFLVIISFIKISIALLLITIMLNILAISYEIHSIGENIKRRTGEKPKFYAFFDNITTILEKTILSKFSNLIK